MSRRLALSLVSHGLDSRLVATCEALAQELFNALSCLQTWFVHVHEGACRAVYIASGLGYNLGA